MDMNANSKESGLPTWGAIVVAVLIFLGLAQILESRLPQPDLSYPKESTAGARSTR
jgi:hypothetical protein